MLRGRARERGAGRYENVYHAGPDQVTRWESRVGPIKEGDIIAGFVVFASDVTARTTAAAERDQVFELSADLLCIARFDGHFARVNPAFVKTLGYSERELLATPFIEFVHPDDRAATKAAFAQVSEGKSVTTFENRYVRKDGAIRLLQWTSMVDQTSKRVIAVARDVTEQRALEAQLLHAQKMDAVGQLAGGIAHDFNNLIQAILGNLHFALRADPDAAMRGYLADIEAASLRAAALTKQLLAFSRRSPLAVASVDLNGVVRELMQLLRRVIPGNIKIDFTAGSQLAAVEADQGQLEQVLMNLCLNARDAMPSGGQINITTETLLVDESHAEARGWRPGRWAVVTVHDTGMGMTPEVRERIFEPFFTTKAVGEGSGLGLAVAYGIVQQHGGMLEVSSEPGRGTTFYLYLPATLRLATIANGEVEPIPSRGKLETILIAEDEQLVREVLVRAFERAGYRVMAAANGADAIKLCREHADAIDLAFLDIVMPDFSGPEVYEHLQQLRPEIPTLFASGYSDTSRLAYRVPAAAPVFAKPFKLDELLAKVREILDNVAGVKRGR